jgi:hypothetical protein
MNLNTFQSEIDPLIVGRGKDYYKSKAVEELTQVSDTEWEAIVSGSDDYEVSIQLDGFEIIGWDCDCPYEQGSVCKHVVAVLLAISNDLSNENSTEIISSEPLTTVKNSTKDAKDIKKPVNEIDSLLEKITNEELRIFVKQNVLKNSDLKNAFLTFFSEKQQGGGPEKYRKIIANITKGASDRYGDINYSNAKKLVKQILELCSKAKVLLAQQNLIESLAITKAIIEETPDILAGMDDSDGGGGEIIDEAFENLENIVDEAPPMLKDELFDYLLAEYPQKKYHDCSCDDNFLYIIPELISSEAQEKAFLSLIDNQIKIEKQNSYGDYAVVNLLQIKCNFLKQTNRKSEADFIIKENIHYHQFRDQLINDAINTNQYGEARQLCLEGISIADQNRYSGIATNFRIKLLEIAKTIEDVSEIRKWAEFLFFDTSHQMKFYLELKKTFNACEWPDKCEQIINKIRKPELRVGLGAANAIATIFIEENYSDRLLALLKLNSSKVEFIDLYAKHIQDKYPVEIIMLYENSVNEYAKNTGRDIYNNVARYLAKMQKISGGQLVVSKMIANYKNIYRIRKAMMEVLDANFK